MLDVKSLSQSKYFDSKIDSKLKINLDVYYWLKGILVKNVLLSVAKVGILFYPNSDIDPLDNSLLPSDEVKNKYSEMRRYL